MTQDGRAGALQAATTGGHIHPRDQRARASSLVSSIVLPVWRAAAASRRSAIAFGSDSTSSVSSSASRSSIASTTTLGRPCLVITTRRCSVSIPSTTSDRRALASTRETCSEAGRTISRTISLRRACRREVSGRCRSSNTSDYGGWDVKVTRDAPSNLNPTGRRVKYRFQLDGPNVGKIFSAAIDGELPEIKFFRTAHVTIKGHDALVLRHGMASHQGVEISGAYDDETEVREAVLTAGDPYGICPVGTTAYFSTPLSNGPDPGIPRPVLRAGVRRRLRSPGRMMPVIPRTSASGHYVIRADGTAAWRFADADYTKRAEPDDVLAALAVLRVRRRRLLRFGDASSVTSMRAWGLFVSRGVRTPVRSCSGNRTSSWFALTAPTTWWRSTRWPPAARVSSTWSGRSNSSSTTTTPGRRGVMADLEFYIDPVCPFAYSQQMGARSRPPT